MDRLAAIYLATQGLLTAAWWLLLITVPAVRGWFRPAAHPDSALFAYWLADLVCVIGGSWLTALLLLRRSPRAVAAAWFTSGALVYAALICLAVALSTREAIAAPALMVPAALVTLGIATRCHHP